MPVGCFLSALQPRAEFMMQWFRVLVRGINRTEPGEAIANTLFTNFELIASFLRIL